SFARWLSRVFVSPDVLNTVKVTLEIAMKAGQLRRTLRTGHIVAGVLMSIYATHLCTPIRF
ncbi:MAG: hypothetical protein WBD95_13965, partial [Xanthobacteraceae bacterium]